MVWVKYKISFGSGKSMLPLSGVNTRVMQSKRVVFPLPFKPAMTFSFPFLHLKETSFRTYFFAFGYLNLKFLPPYFLPFLL